MGAKTMRVATSISNWGVITVNTGPDMFEILYGDYGELFLIPGPGVIFQLSIDVGYIQYTYMI